MKEKVILAYSGGLDTTAIIPWLKENFDYEVICVCVDCGQAEELDGLEERAKSCGASKLYIENVIKGDACMIGKLYRPLDRVDPFHAPSFRGICAAALFPVRDEIGDADLRALREHFFQHS